MADVLIVVPPLPGHVAPLAGVAAELGALGHRVAWVGSPAVVHAVAGADADVLDDGLGADLAAGVFAERGKRLRNFAALQHLWEGFLVPLAERMLPAVHAAIQDRSPALLLCDQQAFAGPLAAQRHGLPWVISASTSTELGDPYAAVPKIGAWIDGLQAGLRTAAGLPADGPDLRFSPHLTLCYSCPALAGEPAPTAGPVRMVGASLSGRAQHVAFPWDKLDRDRHRLLVSLGTMNDDAGADFLARCRAAFAPYAAELQPVIVDSAAEAVTETDGALVLPRVPQLELLAEMSAVIGHGGHNTVVESLAHGLPMVLAPIRDDQPIVARQVVTAGAGEQVRFDRATPEQLAAATLRVLHEPGYRDAAAGLSRELAAAGGAPAAARAITDVLPTAIYA